MRIGILSWESKHSISIGGVAAHVSDLAASLKPRGHEVHLFTRPAYGDGGVFVIEGVYYHYCKFDLHHNFIEEINNMCRSFVYHFFKAEDEFGLFDLVHAHDWLSSNAAVWIKEGRGKKMVLTMHSTEYGRCGNHFYDGESNLIRDHERNAINCADRVITVSNALKKEISWIYDVSDSKVTTIYNGISPYQYNGLFSPNEIHDRINVSYSDPVVLFAGRITEQKGADILIHSIPLVLQYFPNTKFVLAGDGNQKKLCEDIARLCRIQNSIRFLGYQNGHFLKYLYLICNLVVVPSRNEPFGIVILEAWNARKPVVATKNGGPSEFVINNVNGLLMDVNPESTALSIVHLIGDSKKARRLGKNGNRSLKKFNWDMIAEQTEALYLD